MQRVSELMQESFHLTECQQSRLVFCWFGEIHYHTDVWTNILTSAIYALSFVFRHPGTSLLSLAGVEVGIEHSKERPIFVKHLISLYVRMVNRYVFVFFESDTIKTVGKSEYTLYHL